mgnify:CR=1 FL=1
MSDESQVSILLNDDQSEALMDMTLSPLMDKRFREVFDLELDLLRAEKCPVGDGRTRYQFTLRDRRKIKYMVMLVNKAGLHQAGLMNDADARRN